MMANFSVLLRFSILLRFSVLRFNNVMTSQRRSFSKNEEIGEIRLQEIPELPSKPLLDGRYINHLFLKIAAYEAR